jgi:hypothetical protein
VGFVVINSVGQTIYIPTYGNYTYPSSSYTLIELPIDVGLSF